MYRRWERFGKQWRAPYTEGVVIIKGGRLEHWTLCYCCLGRFLQAAC
jgi:hypothetical protein